MTYSLKSWHQCSLVGGNQCFRGTFCLNLQPWRWKHRVFPNLLKRLRADTTQKITTWMMPWESKKIYIILIQYGNISVAFLTAEFYKHRRVMITSERQVGVPPEFITSKSTAHPFGEPLFYSPASHTISRQKHSPTNGFFEELRPILFVQKISGIFPYHVSPTGKFL
jgi:hypothetical protein